MDLFLVTGPKNSKISTAMLGFAGLAIAALYILSKVFSQEDEDDDMDEPQDRKANKPAGIINEGNTCFVNSLLQALSSLESFQRLLKHTSQSFKGPRSPHEQLIIELSSVLSCMLGLT
jgi:ubiquitin C-terminal hydrolase